MFSLPIGKVQVKIQIIQVINKTSLKKQFRVEYFLNQFNISNSQQIRITTLNESINQQLIKSQFKILTKN